MDVRRLAVVDMYGTRGTQRRRRIILAEFVISCLGGIAIGLWLLVAGSNVAFMVFGALIIGIGLNYAPLLVYAIQFSRRGALEAEVADVDVTAELRRYSVWQMWVFLPLAFVVLDVQRRRRVG
jgi:hypothetical protein